MVTINFSDTSCLPVILDIMLSHFLAYQFVYEQSNLYDAAIAVSDCEVIVHHHAL